MKTIAIILLTVLIGTAAAAPLYSEDISDNPDARVFEGKVTNVDYGGSTLTVQGGVVITFRISRDTKLVRDTYDIRLLDINPGDYVAVSYVREGLKSLVPMKVFSVTVRYQKDSQTPGSW